MSSPGRRDVVELRVAVRERRDAASPGERADAEHVRQGRRPARVRPGLRGRLVGVARPPRRRARPSRPRRRPRPPRASSRCHGSGWPGSRGPLRLMLITRAPLATAQRIAFASASTGIEPCGPTTFAIEELRRRREPGDADAVVRPGGDQPGDERAVALGVDRGRPLDEALRRRDAAAQLGMRCRRRPSRSRRRGPPRAAAARSTRRTTGSGRRTTACGRSGSFGHVRLRAGCRAARRSARRATPRSAEARVGA